MRIASCDSHQPPISATTSPLELCEAIRTPPHGSGFVRVVSELRCRRRAVGRSCRLETQVRTPQSVFLLPQRLVVPLFQRPYVWNLDNQWEPLWSDVARLAERYLASPASRHQPHFLGAVVLQQVMKPIGHLQERMIIDGQQRLTTLQLLLDALHAELVRVGATSPAARLESLVTNDTPFRTRPEDRFKVWPTNRDRPAFNAVMSATPPVITTHSDSAVSE